MIRNIGVRTLKRLRNCLSTDIGPRWAAPYTLNPQFIRLRNYERCSHPYGWGILQGVRLAKMLGQKRASVIEFGVAGGNGLLAMETIAARVESMFGVQVDVYGFDTGTGLPKPHDVRDMPNLWGEGAFRMDVSKLQSRLQRAKLILGPVETTIQTFLESRPAPVAFVSFDVDYYSSTMDALEVFQGDVNMLLPRVHCYFDDILGYTFGDQVGERLAISEFNNTNEKRKLSFIHALRYYMPKRFAHELTWDHYYMLHNFDHPRYGDPDGMIDRAQAPSISRL